jgi:outer membrane protein assembly factor BamB
MRAASRMVRLAMGAGIAIVAGSVTAVSALAASAAVPVGSWSQTNYNAAQSRANLGETTLTPATVGKSRYLRSVVAPPTPPAKQGCQPDTVAVPVLTGGNLYAVANGWLSRYDAATGRRIWRHLAATAGEAGSLRYQALAVAGGFVVVGESDCGSVSDPNGYIQAFRASTGALVWSRQITAGNGNVNAVVVYGGYVVAAGSSVGGGTIVAVRKLTTGGLVWARSFQFCAAASLAVVDQLVMSPGCKRTGVVALTARKLATGKLVWSRSGAWQIQRGDLPGLAGSHLNVISSTGSVLDLNPATGHTRHTLAGATAVLAVDGSRAYAACGTGAVCAYSTSAGSQMWTTPDSAPVLAAEAGGVLYLADGTVLNASTGKIITRLWSGQAQSLVVGNGRIGAVTDPRILDLYGLAGS